MNAKRSTTIRNKHRAQIKRGRPACSICGQPIDYTLTWPEPGAFVVDHIVPINRGGEDVLANKQAAHASCNRAKSDRDHAPIIKHSGALRLPGGE